MYQMRVLKNSSGEEDDNGLRKSSEDGSFRVCAVG